MSADVLPLHHLGLAAHADYENSRSSQMFPSLLSPEDTHMQQQHHTHHHLQHQGHHHSQSQHLHHNHLPPPPATPTQAHSQQLHHQLQLQQSPTHSISVSRNGSSSSNSLGAGNGGSTTANSITGGNGVGIISSSNNSTGNGAGGSNSASSNTTANGNGGSGNTVNPPATKRRRSDALDAIAVPPPTSEKRIKRHVDAPMARPASSTITASASAAAAAAAVNSRPDRFAMPRRASYDHAPTQHQQQQQQNQHHHGLLATDPALFGRMYEFGFGSRGMVDPTNGGGHDIKYLPHPSPTTSTGVDSMPSATYPSSAGHEYVQSPFGTHHQQSHHHGDASGGPGSVNGASNGVVDAYSAAASTSGMTRHLSISSAYPNPYGGLPVQPFNDPLPQSNAGFSQQDISPPPSAYPMHPPPTPYGSVPPNSATFAPSEADEAVAAAAAAAAASGMMGPGMPGDASMQMTPDPAGGAASWGFYSPDTTLHLKIQTLPVLDNLAKQILGTLARSSLQDIIRIITEPNSGRAQAYVTLLALFEDSKRLYSSRESLFIDRQTQNLDRPEYQEQLRRANYATFFSSVFSTQQDLFQLHDHFLDVFAPIGHWLLSWHADLFLQLKLQAYVAAMVNGTVSSIEAIHDLFPLDLEQQLLARHPPESPQLAPSEQDFVNRSMGYRQSLMSEPETPEAISALPEKYSWTNFLHEAAIAVNRLAAELDIAGMSPGDNHSPIDGDRRASVSFGGMGGLDVKGRELGAMGPPDVPAHLGGNGAYLTSSHHVYPNPPPPGLTFHPLTGAPMGPNGLEHIPTTPTQILYERAREAANTKASPPCRKPNGTSQRRPWSAEEERALMDGLDRVKGPHWSQILALYGAGGTVSEVLKDRNQVQLKDKARNLKLFFLKSGIDVPYYLQCVTGELKTRAPAQAAKREKEQLAKAAMAAGK